MSKYKDKNGCSGCLYSAGLLIWLFIKPILAWTLIGLIIAGILYLTGYYEKASQQAQKDYEWRLEHPLPPEEIEHQAEVEYYRYSWDNYS